MVERPSTFCVMMIAVSLFSCIPGTVSAEEWLKFTEMSLELPGKEGVVKGYSESYYDNRSVRRDGSGHIQVRLKEITYLGDLEPHIHKELLQIDCGTNRFITLVEESATPNGYREINRGTIGDDSPYRLVRAVFCGY